MKPHAITIWVLDHDGASHYGVSHSILVLGADSKLVLVALDEFFYIAVSAVPVDVGAD